MTGLDLTPLEKAVLDALQQAYPEHKATLSDQISKSIASSRRLTHTGFFLDIFTWGNLRFEKDMELNSVYANIPSLEAGAGFILFVRNGLISFLEGYTYEEAWPTNVRDYEVYIDR